MNKRRVRRGGRGGGRRFVRPEKGKYKPKNTVPGLRVPNWNNVNLEPFQKNFYREHPNVMNRLRQDVERFRNKHEITVQGMALNPIENFDEVFMPDYVAREIRNQGYAKPTPIQSQTWPIAFSGFNLVGIAQTGSGKTLAYILPAIIHINNQPNIKPGDGPIAVVLAPTRELAVQIQQVAIEFGTSTHIRTVCTVGGIDKKPQEAELLKGCEIVVATPGRLLDFLSANVTNMKRCTYLVLDEADRMLDMGFEAQIREIISQIRPDKQILMWSATWPREIRQLAEDFLGNYIQVNIGSLELSANHNIKQFVHICQENEKSSKLQLLLRQIYQANNPGKILIFVSKKKRADMISKYINNFGVACESLHGDKPQSQRTKILDDFRSGRSNIIVATDVAARGLDVDGIMYVINLDFPKLIEDYVHRIGRCGRCDRMGISYAFFTLNDAKQAKELIAILNEANQPVDAKLQEIAFNPKKPEKIDKKQRRLNENSGFDVPLPEKRQHDGHNANFSSGAGPSSSSGRAAAYMGEPDCKRGRIVEPLEPVSERNVTFNRNSEQNFRDERNVNRGYMDIPSTISNLNRVDDSAGLRLPFEDRNVDRFQSDERDFMNDQTSARLMRERQLEELERSIEERIRAQQRPVVDRFDDFRMTDGGSNDLRRFQPVTTTSFDRDEPVTTSDRMRNIPDLNFNRRENFGRLNDFNDRSNDRMMPDLFDDVQRPNRDILPIRDNLLGGMDRDNSRLGPMFNSSVHDRRNFENRDLIDDRNIYSSKAANFQETLNNRTYEERRGISQEFRRITPDPMLDRSDVSVERFLNVNQSRDDESFDSLQHFGRRRGDRDHFDSGFDSRFDDRRNDFIDNVSPNQPSNQSTSSRWNDFASRDAYPQDRRDFNNDMDSRLRNDFNRDSGEMNFNFTRNNDFDDDFRNRNRRDFDGRNNDDRFSRFNRFN